MAIGPFFFCSLTPRNKLKMSHIWVACISIKQLCWWYVTGFPAILKMSEGQGGPENNNKTLEKYHYFVLFFKRPLSENFPLCGNKIWGIECCTLYHGRADCCKWISMQTFFCSAPSHVCLKTIWQFLSIFCSLVFCYFWKEYKLILDMYPPSNSINCCFCCWFCFYLCVIYASQNFLCASEWLPLLQMSVDFVWSDNLCRCIMKLLFVTGWPIVNKYDAGVHWFTL